MIDQQPSPNHQPVPEIVMEGVYEAPAHQGQAERQQQEYTRYHVEEVGIGFGKQSEVLARAELESALPGVDFTLLGSPGSGGVVYSDGLGHAYKVFRSPGRYGMVETEAAAIALLSREGIAPELHVLIDAAPQFQTEKAGVAPDSYFSEVIIPRKQGQGKLPILVMEQLDFDGDVLTQIGDDLPEEFAQLAEVALRTGVIFLDPHLVVDKANGKLKFIDFGGTIQVKSEFTASIMEKNNQLLQDSGLEPMSEEEARQVYILEALGYAFDRQMSVAEVVQAWRRGGARAVGAAILAHPTMVRRGASRR